MQNQMGVIETLSDWSARLSTEDSNGIWLTLLSTEDSNGIWLTLLSTEDSNGIWLTCYLLKIAMYMTHFAI